MGFLGSPAGAAAQLLDGTLKLRCCTTIFTKRFHPWVLPRFGDGVGKRYAVTSDFLMDCRSNFGKRVRLTRNTRAGIPVHDVLDPGHPTPRRWKIFLLLALLGQGLRGRTLQSFFSAWASVRFAPGKLGTSLRREKALEDSQAEWVGALSSTFFLI